MATIKVIGDVVVVTSTLKLEDLLMVQKYRPDALTLMGGEDGKTPVFKVVARPGQQGSIDKFGAVFGSAGHSDKGLATATLPLRVSEGTDIKSYLADTYGAAIANLGKVEEAVPAVLEAVKTERKSFMDAITVE